MLRTRASIGFKSYPYRAKWSGFIRPRPISVLDGLRRKAMADQIATVSKLRLLRRLGALAKTDIDSVKHTIRVELGHEALVCRLLYPGSASTDGSPS